MTRIPQLLLRTALLLTAALAAVTAHAGVSVGVSIGVPVVGAWGGPYGAIGVHYGGYYGPRHPHYYRPGCCAVWPGVAFVAPWYAPIVVEAPAVVQAPAPTPPVVIPPSRPEPIVYPRNGQDAQQTEADRQACDRWATTQQAAMSDATVFRRAVEACMDGRGYTMR